MKKTFLFLTTCAAMMLASCGTNGGNNAESTCDTAANAEAVKECVKDTTNWQTFNTLAEAATAAGVSFIQPKILADSAIQAIKAVPGKLKIEFASDGNNFVYTKKADSTCCGGCCKKALSVATAPVWPRWLNG